MPINPALKKLRTLMKRPGFFYSLGVWDPYTARVSEALGIECVHIGGYQLGIGNCTSEPLITLTELAYATRMVSNAVKIPVIVDCGAGYGEPLHVMRTVREIEQAGAAGLHIEDQIYPKRVHYHQGIEHTISREELVTKIKYALAARTDPDFLIMGRTDAMKTEGFEEGVIRANMMLEAGADAVQIFPNTLEECRRAPKEIKGPIFYVNSEGNRFDRPLFTVKEFNEMGYKSSTNPTALLCPVTQEIKRVVTNIMTHGESLLPKKEMIAWRKECETLIGLDEMYKVEMDTVEK
ncbi:MAG: isocitrate lyase/PEP mutase family protein [Betaproteobacteria bacterium]|jgi:methylisocitrate lyase